MEKKDILVINPGSTSTKIAIFREGEKILDENVFHDQKEIDSFPTIASQKEYRTEYVKKQLEKEEYDLTGLAAVIGRGGMVIDLQEGGYRVTPELCSAMESPRIPPHAASLGALIAYQIAEKLGIPSYIYDSTMGCDILDVAKITGVKELEKYGCTHVLNQRAQAMRFAESKGKKLEDMNLIVCHMGGGITACALKNGKIIDTAAYDDGPMSPERSGGLPLLLFKDYIFDNNLTRKDVTEMISGKGGIYSYLGTKDCIEVENRIERGDDYAKLIYDAMAFQIAKAIAGLSVALKGEVDAVIMTGGIAHSKPLCDKIEEYSGHIGPFTVLPGEKELEALAEGAERMLKGQEAAKVYHGKYSRDDK